MDIKEYIINNKIIFDGGMGTYFAEKFRDYNGACEYANSDHPEYIEEIHREYLKAGCSAIKTNTFSANPVNYAGDDKRLQDIISAACDIAKSAVSSVCAEGGRENGRQAFIFADIGPIIGADREQASDAYRRTADVFLLNDIGNFLFETNSSDAGILEAAEYIKSKRSDAFIIASFAVQPDGYTREGLYFADVLKRIKESPYIDAAGMNCVSGAFHMKRVLSSIDISDVYFSVMPNAGYPRVVGSRTFYDSDPVFFAEQMEQMAGQGAVFLGGCCGTRPNYIRELVRRISGSGAGKKVVYRSGADYNEDAEKRRKAEAAQAVSVRDSQPEDNRLWNKMAAGKKVIAVELDPPRQADGTKFMSGAWSLKAAGADAITIADCATARASMDSSIMACKLRRELDVDTIPHMTCRDRNLNATKALLLGLSMEGVRNVLTVTGDPVPSAERNEVKSVYQFNSRMLAGFIKSLNENEMEKPFRIYGALNVNAAKFDYQLKFAKEKEENGISGFLTQPVLTEAALENLKAARRSVKGKILGGIIPVVSSRNARFMNSEISGITVDEKIVELYEGKSRDECTEFAVNISTEIARLIAPYVDGYYLITPFSRTDIISQIIKNIRQELIN